jgi:hypothetical protein
MNTKVRTTLVTLGVGIALVGLVSVLSRQAEGTPDDEIAELQAAILSAVDLIVLNDYHNQIGELLTAGTITIEEYSELYTAYVRRFYQLTGVGA